MKRDGIDSERTFSAKKYILLLAFIGLFAFVIRLIGMDRVPPGIPTDTLLYFSNARAIAETGRDIYNHAFPLFSSHKGFLLSPVTVYVITLFYKIFGFSHLIGYLPNLLMSTLSIVVAALLATKLTGNRKIGIFTALILTVSPWHYHLSRTGFEGIFGFSLVLIGTYYSILALQKPRYYILSFFLFTVAAFCYKAINVFLVSYPVLYLSSMCFKKPAFKKGLLFSLSIWSVVALQWFLMFVLYRDTYSNGYININVDTAGFVAQEERAMSDAPRVVRVMVSNLPVVLSGIYAKNYLHFFSPQYLLTQGDSDKRFSTGNGGQLYLLDVIFVIAGMVWLYKTNRKSILFFLVSIILAAPLASLISDQQYAIRTFISVFVFAILGGCGIEAILLTMKGKRYGKILTIGIGLLYCWSVFLYLYRYHYLYIHYSREAWGGANKEVMLEAHQRRNDYERITFGTSSEFEYIEFMYWNTLPVVDIQKALTTYDEHTLSYQNIFFVRDCGPIKSGELLYTQRSCYDSQLPTHIYYLPKLLIWQWKSYILPKTSQ